MFHQIPELSIIYVHTFETFSETDFSNVYTSIKAIHFFEIRWRVVARRRIDFLMNHFFRPDLVRPAHSLYMHNLTGLLEAAIRATNAQFDDPESLKRLDCRLLEV